MKKLMIAAAVAISAVALNAATFAWGLSPVDAPEGKSPAAGWAVYYLDASKYAGMATAEDIASYVTSNYKYQDATSFVSGRGGSQTFVASSTSGKGSYSKGQSESGFLVLFDAAAPADASYYAMTSVKTSDVVGDLGNDITIDFGTFAAGTTGWQSIPEPTSGLLLLIGVAGLALRRRRA